jgi:hypothetical protein
MQSRSDMVIRNKDELNHFLKLYDTDYKVRAYVNKVYGLIEQIKPGMFITIDKLVSEQNLNMFIKSVCLYIIESKRNNIEFSNDYLTIKKLNFVS